MQIAKRVQDLSAQSFVDRSRFFILGLGLPIGVSIAGILLARQFFVSWATDALIFFFLVPVGVLLITRKSVLDHGLRVGDRKLGLLAAGIGIVASIVVVGVAASLSPGVQSYYGNRDLTPRLVLQVATYMFAWEFLLRGYVLCALQKRVGFMRANIIQSVIFFLAHAAKPPLEFYSTAFTGPIFGYISEKTRSIYSMVAIHTAIYLSVIYFTQ
jgi:membrane protease YdiL (CAAX protease family)